MRTTVRKSRRRGYAFPLPTTAGTGGAKQVEPAATYVGARRAGTLGYVVGRSR
ncbi:hypothetical protein [Nocardia carnea]|uniref:hypothetical protein n=1 Tax=Nocardia carnea TaxID=37328 RepID=UPI002456222A|nr:hypothetical protein [Nocardia carnea]